MQSVFPRLILRRFLIVLFSLMAALPSAAQTCEEAFDGVLGAGSYVLPPEQRFRVDDYLKFIEKLKQFNHPGLKVVRYATMEGDPLYMIRLESVKNPNALEVSFVTGVHGSEARGVDNGLLQLDHALRNPDWAQDFNFSFFFAVNPGGLRAGTRYTKAGMDMNRSFFLESQDPAIRSVLDEIAKTKDKSGIIFDMHEAEMREDIFIVKNGDDNGLAKRALSRLSEEVLLRSEDGKYPIDVATPHNPKAYELQAPGVAVSTTPGTLKKALQELGFFYSYTVETPGRMDKNQAQEYVRQAVILMIEERLRDRNVH